MGVPITNSTSSETLLAARFSLIALYAANPVRGLAIRSWRDQVIGPAGFTASRGFWPGSSLTPRWRHNLGGHLDGAYVLQVGYWPSLDAEMLEVLQEQEIKVAVESLKRGGGACTDRVSFPKEMD